MAPVVIGSSPRRWRTSCPDRCRAARSSGMGPSGRHSYWRRSSEPNCGRNSFELTNNQQSSNSKVDNGPRWTRTTYLCGKRPWALRLTHAGSQEQGALQPVLCGSRGSRLREVEILGDRTLVAMELDHVLMAVADLATAGREIEVRHGLASIEGGRHPAWGTANRIVPLGDSYLELVAVFDAVKATESAFGRWVASGVSRNTRPLGWAVRTSQLDAIARRLDLSIQDGSRATPDGEQLKWRSAGIDQAAAEPSLPFFIEWGPQTQLPGQAAIRHRAGVASIARLAIDADPGRLADWIAGNQLPIVVRAGVPAVTTIYISSDEGEIVLGSVGG